MPDSIILERRETAKEAVGSRILATVKVLLVLMTMALPIALAGPANATTTSAASLSTSVVTCTMKTPQNPIGGTDFPTGKANVTYKVTVNCSFSLTPIYVQVQQKFYEWDSSGSQPIPPKRTSFFVLPFGGSHTFSVTEFLPNTESGAEEMWQKAHMAYVKALPLPTNMPYGPYKSSGQTSISN